MSMPAPKPATTPIPVQLSADEFDAFIFPHLSMPKRGPKCKLGYHRVFNLILWVLYTEMQGRCKRHARGERTSIRVWCSPTWLAPGHGNAVRTPDLWLTTSVPGKRKKKQKPALRGSVSLDTGRPHKGQTAV